MADVLDDAAPAAAPARRPSPLATAASGSAPAKRDGLPPMTWAFAAIAVAMLLWGAWVTKHIATPPAQAPIASVRLEALVTEYVQAQSHSNGSPDSVTRQTGRFMAAIENELKRIGATGTTVLVGEAVLSRNVPDITDQVRRAVYARVPLPAAAPAAPPPIGAIAPASSTPIVASSLPVGTLPQPAATPAGPVSSDATSLIEGGSDAAPR